MNLIHMYLLICFFTIKHCFAYQAVCGRWPNAVVQFEDFETTKAVPLLEKYRNKYHCFNDDIQGTGCVTLAGIIAASRAADKSICDMRFMCVGKFFYFFCDNLNF